MRNFRRSVSLLVVLCIANYTVLLVYWQIRETQPHNTHSRFVDGSNHTHSINQTHSSNTSALKPETGSEKLGEKVASDGDVFKHNLTTPRKEARFLIEPNVSIGDLLISDYDLRCRNFQPGKVFETRWNLVIFVKSKATNFDRRRAIRTTWGKYQVIEGVRIEKVFVMGKVDSEEVQANIHKENASNGDILQYDGPDDYRNMPMKISSAMQWASYNLPSEYIYASTDDDFLINFASALSLINAKINRRDENTANFTETLRSLPIFCLYYKGEKSTPERNKDNKYFISVREYSKSVYPHYCGGGFYTVAVSMLRELFNLSRVTAILPMDDVWVTGILRQKLGRGDDNIDVIEPPRPIPKDKIIWKHLWGDYGKKEKNIPKMLFEAWRAWEPDVAREPFCIRDSPISKTVTTQSNSKTNS